MHVTDGILPLSVCLAGYAVALGETALCSRKLESEEVPRMGLMASAAFVASMVHVPVAGASVHFGLFGLLGLVLGLRAVPVIFAILVFQTFLFQHGGFLSLGVNVMNMSAGALAGILVGRLGAAPLSVRGFLAGFAGVVAPALLLLMEFLVAGYGKSLLLLAGVYCAIGLAEGAFTSMVVVFLARVKPAALSALPAALPIPAREAN